METVDVRDRRLRVGGDPLSLIRLNDAGVGIVVPVRTRHRHRHDRLPRDSIPALEPAGLPDAGARVSGDQPPHTLFKNPDPAANRAAILGQLMPAAGLNNSSVAGWYLWDEPPLYYPPKRRLSPDEAFARIHEMTRLIRDSDNGASTHDKLPS